jgi:hypothetical protein
MSQIADVLERFRRGGELLSTATLGCAGMEADFKPSPGQWSVRQIVCHLSDTQIVTGMRLRLIIAEDKPTLGAFDQEAWANHLNYDARKISHAIETFRRLRTDDYELLKDLPPEAFERTGNHAERGVLTLGQLVQQQAEHVESHVQQIQAVRAAYKEYRSKDATTRI